MMEISKSMVIREASFKDLKNIADLHAQSWRENYSKVLSSAYLLREVDADRTKVWTSRLIESPTNQFVSIAELDNEFCGFVCAFGAMDPELGTIIDNLHVKSSAKGKGIGTKLLVTAAKWADTNFKNDNLYLEVLEENSKAIKFYESLGAINVGATYWHTPCGNHVKEFLYSWGSPRKLANKSQNNAPSGADAAENAAPV